MLLLSNRIKPVTLVTRISWLAHLQVLYPTLWLPQVVSVEGWRTHIQCFCSTSTLCRMEIGSETHDVAYSHTSNLWHVLLVVTPLLIPGTNGVEQQMYIHCMWCLVSVLVSLYRWQWWGPYWASHRILHPPKKTTLSLTAWHALISVFDFVVSCHQVSSATVWSSCSNILL